MNNIEEEEPSNDKEESSRNNKEEEELRNNADGEEKDYDVLNCDYRLLRLEEKDTKIDTGLKSEKNLTCDIEVEIEERSEVEAETE